MFLSTPLGQAYIWCAVALSLNLFFLLGFVPIIRTKAGQAVNPEDVGKKDLTVVYYDGSEATQRAMRAHSNALENIPLFLITGFLLTLTSISVTFATVLFAVFAVARWAHTFTYLKSIQPLRTISFATGFFTQMIVVGYLAYAALIA